MVECESRWSSFPSNTTRLNDCAIERLTAASSGSAARMLCSKNRRPFHDTYRRYSGGNEANCHCFAVGTGTHNCFFEFDWVSVGFSEVGACSDLFVRADRNSITTVTGRPKRWSIRYFLFSQILAQFVKYLAPLRFAGIPHKHEVKQTRSIMASFSVIHALSCCKSWFRCWSWDFAPNTRSIPASIIRLKDCLNCAWDSEYLN